MTSKKEVLKTIHENDIPAVMIGGLAMRIYNSPRVTHDMDLAVRTLDVDKIITLMYELGFHLAVSADDEQVRFCVTVEDALGRISEEKPGSMSFFQLSGPVTLQEVPITSVDITTEIDVLYDISIPFSRLLKRAQVIELEKVSISVASPEDLLYLKEKREDKSPSDYADIEYLKNLLSKE